jgi:hypothetical protein
MAAARSSDLPPSMVHDAGANTQSKGMIRTTFALEAFPRQPQLARVQEIVSFAHIFIASVFESDGWEDFR